MPLRSRPASNADGADAPPAPAPTIDILLDRLRTAEPASERRAAALELGYQPAAAADLAAALPTETSPLVCEAIFTALTAPLLLPTLVLGLGILLVFFPFGLAATWPGLAIAHLAVTLPFVVRIMVTALSTLPPDLEDAAATLGATPLTVVRRVTLPLALPGLIASGALAFLISFDEVVISLFIVGPRLSTLPVEMYRYVEGRTDPMVAALAVVLIVFSLSVVLLVERLLGFMRAVGR